MKGVFKRFLNLFTHNWGLKLLSLALAIVIYHSLNHPTPSADHDRRNPNHEQQSIFKR